jgi:hypothetical protein
MPQVTHSTSATYGNGHSQREIQHRHRDEQHGCELHLSEAFPQKERAEEHIHERRHEVAEARFEHAPRVHGPDERQPVQRHDDAARDAVADRAARGSVRTHLRPAALQCQQQDEERCRPDEAMREDLRRGDGAEKLPVNRMIPQKPNAAMPAMSAVR